MSGSLFVVFRRKKYENIFLRIFSSILGGLVRVKSENHMNLLEDLE